MYYVSKCSILLAGRGVCKTSSVAYGFSSIKIDYSDYLKSLISRINVLAHQIGISVVFTHGCEILLSHIPTHTRSSDPYVSSLSEKSVPHRYPCEIS